jgi:hypothetical protein
LVAEKEQEKAREEDIRDTLRIFYKIYDKLDFAN